MPFGIVLVRVRVRLNFAICWRLNNRSNGLPDIQNTLYRRHVALPIENVAKPEEFLLELLWLLFDLWGLDT